MENTNVYNNIKENFNAIVDLLEKSNNPPPQRLHVHDRELTGNKINGGMITNFSSVGIRDIANEAILEVSDKGIRVRKAELHEILTPLQVNGDLTVAGEISAERLTVKELTADIRLERSTPLAFRAENNSIHGLGLLWTGVDYTRQFIYQNPNKFFSTEDIDLYTGKSYKINDIPVLSQTSLGTTVRKSNLTELGTVENLKTTGSIDFDNFVFYNSTTNRLGFGTENPNGTFSIKNETHEFIISDTAEREFLVGTYTTSDLSLITDNKCRLKISNNGAITIESKTIINNKLGIGLSNFSDDVDITTAGPVRFQNKKFEVGSSFPTSGNYIKGDIVWNNNPQPTGYVGWVCIRSGGPGEWKAFGNIQQ